MNKILIDNIIYEDNIINIEEEIKKIVVSKDTVINIFNASIKDLEIDVKDNSKLLINYFRKINQEESKIVINTENNASCTFNHSFINEVNYKLTITTSFKHDNSVIKVNIHGINDVGVSEIIENGYVLENKNNNSLDESIKIINLNDGQSISMPNMFIDNYLVNANHNNTVSKINDDELFYFESKAITRDNAKTLICNGFINSIIDDTNLRIKILEFLNTRRWKNE